MSLKTSSSIVIVDAGSAVFSGIEVGISNKSPIPESCFISVPFASSLSCTGTGSALLDFGSSSCSSNIPVLKIQ